MVGTVGCQPNILSPFLFQTEPQFCLGTELPLCKAPCLRGTHPTYGFRGVGADWSVPMVVCSSCQHGVVVQSGQGGLKERLLAASKKVLFPFKKETKGRDIFFFFFFWTSSHLNVKPGTTE